MTSKIPTFKMFNPNELLSKYPKIPENPNLNTTQYFHGTFQNSNLNLVSSIPSYFTGASHDSGTINEKRNGSRPEATEIHQAKKLCVSTPSVLSTDTSEPFNIYNIVKKVNDELKTFRNSNPLNEKCRIEVTFFSSIFPIDNKNDNKKYSDNFIKIITNLTKPNPENIHSKSDLVKYLEALYVIGFTPKNISSILHGARSKGATAMESLYDEIPQLKELREVLKPENTASILHGVGKNVDIAIKRLVTAIPNIKKLINEVELKSENISNIVSESKTYAAEAIQGLVDAIPKIKDLKNVLCLSDISTILHRAGIKATQRIDLLIKILPTLELLQKQIGLQSNTIAILYKRGDEKFEDLINNLLLVVRSDSSPYGILTPTVADPLIKNMSLSAATQQVNFIVMLLDLQNKISLMMKEDNNSDKTPTDKIAIIDKAISKITELHHVRKNDWLKNTMNAMLGFYNGIEKLFKSEINSINNNNPMSNIVVEQSNSNTGEPKKVSEEIA